MAPPAVEVRELQNMPRSHLKSQIVPGNLQNQHGKLVEKSWYFVIVQKWKPRYKHWNPQADITTIGNSKFILVKEIYLKR